MHTLIALCAIGLEKALANELRALGFRISRDAKGMFEFETDEEGIARANIALRTAERILLKMAAFPSADFDQLFEGIRSIPWEQYCLRDTKIVFEKLRLSRSALSSVPAVQSVAQKAVYERLGKAFHAKRLPERGETVSLRLYLENDSCLVGMDLSGEALHRRGYRKFSGPAPLKETIAAGLILLSGWRRKHPFRDPFCGTGTLPIEAALYAYEIPPGLNRSFAFEGLSFYDPAACSRAREELKSRIDFSRETRISGSDISAEAIAAAEANSKAAGLGGKLRFFRKPMEETEKDAEGGFIITNPPSGERLGDAAEAEELYRGMKALAPNFSGWKLGVVTSHPDFPGIFGKKAEKTREIQNGAIRERFSLFAL